MITRRLSLLIGILLVTVHMPVAQAQALPGQLLLNAASWAFQKMMEEANKPLDPYAAGNSFGTPGYDHNAYDPRAFAPGNQYAPRSPSFAPTFDASTSQGNGDNSR